VADPYELTNIIHTEAHSELCRELTERLLAHMAAVGEPPATITPAEKHPSGQRRVDPAEVLA
jgi:hypothetical protein